MAVAAANQELDILRNSLLSIAVIGPQAVRREAICRAFAGPGARVTREIPAYPDLEEVEKLLKTALDVVVVELDSDAERALTLVEEICSHSPVTVMVYSARADADLLVRCMRAGAREFLNEPFAPGILEEALVRAASRRSSVRTVRKATGKLFVFAGAKGGSGVTTIASNFAICVAQESAQSTLLIDLYLPLGDAGLNLGVNAQFSTVNALQNHSRLDSNFLAKLLNKHSSGLSVLSAPDRFMPDHASEEAVSKLLNIARQDFDYVVVDTGANVGPMYKTLFESATTAYLVTQVSISELRNSNRFISEFFPFRGPKLEVVLNRFTPRMLEIDEESITKALNVPAKWKVPSDYQTVHRAQNTGTPLALEESPVSAAIRQMARAACGLPVGPEKKKRFNLFG